MISQLKLREFVRDCPHPSRKVAGCCWDRQTEILPRKMKHLSCHATVSRVAKRNSKLRLSQLSWLESSNCFWEVLASLNLFARMKIKGSLVESSLSSSRVNEQCFAFRRFRRFFKITPKVGNEKLMRMSACCSFLPRDYLGLSGSAAWARLQSFEQSTGNKLLGLRLQSMLSIWRGSDLKR